MPHRPQLRIPATYMRGGTSKGVFFKRDDLPEAARVPGAARDALLMRVIGSPACGAMHWHSVAPEVLQCERAVAARYWHHRLP